MRPQTEVRPLPLEAILPLRAAVLRPGRAVTAAIFPGDDALDTLHLGIFKEAALVGVASLYPRPVSLSQPDSSHATTAWQLRGMAIDPTTQRQGYGQVLLRECLCQVTLRGGTLLWCNARTEVVGFYQAMGFVAQGDEFMIPGVGPHFFMSRPLP